MKDERTKPFAVCLFVYFAVGSMVLTTSTVMKSIIAEYSWSDSQGAMIVTCMSVGFLIMSALGNLTMERIGRKASLLIGGGIMFGCYLLFALLPVPVLYYPLMLVAGLSWGLLNCLVNTVVSELYGGNPSKLNLMNACYAFGAVLLPMLVGLMTMNSVQSWRLPCYLVVAFGAVLLLLGLRVPLPEKPAKKAAEGGAALSRPFWREAGFYISLIVFFVYVGVETAAQSWLSPYLSQTNTFFKENVPSETMVSLMWGMILCGRLLFAAIGGKIDRRWLLVGLSVGFLVGLVGVILLCGSTVPAILSVAVMGFSMSALYATAVSNANRYVTGSPVAAGLIFGSAGVGSSVLPLLAGIFSDSMGLKAGMTSLCFFLALLLCASVINLKISERQS